MHSLLLLFTPKTSIFLCTVPPARSPSPLLSSSDFPALTAQPPQPPSASSEPPAETRADASGTQPDEKAARRAEKKAAATERAAERAKRRAEKECERAEKRVEKEKLERERKEKKERLEKEREEWLEKEKTAKSQRERERARELEEATAKAEAQKKATTSAKVVQKGEVAASPASKRKSNIKSAPTSKTTSTPAPVPSSALSSPPSQGPLLSKLPKKNRPVTKPIKIPKEDEIPAETPSVLTSAATSEAPQLPLEKISGTVLDANSTSSRGESMERTTSDPTSVGELLAQIERQYPTMDLAHHPFFDAQKLNPTSKMTLEYGPLAHALSALSVGGGSFANNMPSGSVDNAVSSFQQLLETLTQTISDLLRLLPRTTWDDSSSFDGVLRDMLKGDDFFDDGSEDKSHTSAGKDEVAALTLALERRARWMEVQLSKLEELHRDINTAAVRAVLAFNDSGWDPHGFAPRTGGTLQRFDTLGMVNVEGGEPRPMTADELEKKLAVAKEAAVFAETEVREIMGRIQAAGLPIDGEY